MFIIQHNKIILEEEQHTVLITVSGDHQQGKQLLRSLPSYMVNAAEEGWPPAAHSSVQPSSMRRFFTCPQLELTLLSPYFWADSDCPFNNTASSSWKPCRGTSAFPAIGLAMLAPLASEGWEKPSECQADNHIPALRRWHSRSYEQYTWNHTSLPHR